MLIRKFVAEDRVAVIDLWLAVFPRSTGHNDPGASIDRKLAASDDLFFVAIEEGNVAGTVMAGYDGHRGWLYSVAVSPVYRRRGVGSRLVQHAESELTRRGCPKVNLQVIADNSEVVAFYRSLGFGVEERISMGKLTGQ
ncbi:GNAT family acetyltransferase [Rhodopirellula bahusiensis]|uniref:GNAT family acetyltransferase n=1 Tax=Rhodopirellula bahusiensis TaxID=2014065 RepID=UPI0032664F96